MFVVIVVVFLVVLFLTVVVFVVVVVIVVVIPNIDDFTENGFLDSFYPDFVLKQQQRVRHRLYTVLPLK